MNEFLVKYKELLKKLRIHQVENKESLIEIGVSNEIFESCYLNSKHNYLFPLKWQIPAQKDKNFIAWKTHYHRDDLPPTQRVKADRVPFLTKSEYDFIKRPELREKVFNLKIELFDYLSCTEKVCVLEVAKIINSFFSILEAEKLSKIEIKYAKEFSWFENAYVEKTKREGAHFLRHYHDISQTITDPIEKGQKHIELLGKKVVFSIHDGGTIGLINLSAEIKGEEQTGVLNSIYQVIKNDYNDFDMPLSAMLTAYSSKKNIVIHALHETYKMNGYTHHPALLFNYYDYRPLFEQVFRVEYNRYASEIIKNMAHLTIETAQNEKSKIYVGDDLKSLAIYFNDHQTISISYHDKKIKFKRSEQPPFSEKSPFVLKSSKDKQAKEWYYLCYICNHDEVWVQNASKLRKEIEESLRAYIQFDGHIFKIKEKHVLKPYFSIRASAYAQCNEDTKQVVNPKGISYVEK